MPPGEIAFYGTREFLDEHIRRRIVIIFSLFTAMVALSTLMMIGLVVRDASTTIRRQGQEIVKTQEGTIKNHVSNILSKMGVRDRTRAVLKAIDQGYI